MNAPLKLIRKWKHYGLRTSFADGTSHSGFQWPNTGTVEALDWMPTKECGNGLHALLGGEGSSSLLNWDDRARWQLVGFDDYIDLGEKVKFAKCEVATGTREQVTQAVRMLCASAPHGLIYSGGDSSAIVAGYMSAITAGYRSAIMAGGKSTITAGDWSTITAGYESTITAGYESTITAGYAPTITAGYGSIIQARWWDCKRSRIITAYVGEDGIKPNVAYKIESGKFVKA